MEPACRRGGADRVGPSRLDEGADAVEANKLVAGDVELSTAQKVSADAGGSPADMEIQCDGMCSAGLIESAIASVSNQRVSIHVEQAVVVQQVGPPAT